MAWRVCWVWAMVATHVLGLGCAAVWADERAFSVQMHLHAHSNHNGSVYPASLQWHTAQAHMHGTDVLWWSEHAAVFENLDTLWLDPAAGTLDEESFVVDLGTTENHINPLKFKKRLSKIVPNVQNGRGQAEIREGYLYSKISPDPASTSDYQFVYRAASEKGLVHMLSWTRPIVGGPVVQINVDCPGWSDGVHRFVEFDLSWHLYEKPTRYRVRFNLVKETEGRAVELKSDTAVVVTVPWDPSLVPWKKKMA